MLVVCTGDGLGNQMFHYALYCALEAKYDKNVVKMSIEDFYGSSNLHNGYELEKIFGIKVNLCTFKEGLFLADYCSKSRSRVLNFIFRWRKRLFGPKSSFITVDDPTIYYKEIFELSPIRDYMFRGNWINENYFKECRSRLLNEFVFPEIREKHNLQFANEIESTNSVSIHVRRGDYLKHGMAHLTIDYYKSAIEYMQRTFHEEITYFIFSDDPQFVREEFSFLKRYVVIEGNSGEINYRDMQLMSKCKHNIISNSTFAFWGAYLNQNTEKIVIAPEVSIDIYKNAFACEEWIKI